MSLWKRLFGSKPKPYRREEKQASPSAPKVAAEADEAPAHPEGKGPLYAWVPEGFPIPQPRDASKLRIDVLLTMSEMANDDTPFSWDVEDMMMRKIFDNQHALLIPAVLKHRKEGTKHALLMFYSEEEAQYYPFYKKLFADEPGWGAPLYFGTTPVEKLPSGEDLPQPQSPTFVDLFVFDEKYEVPNNLYTMWSRHEEEMLLNGSPLAAVIDEIAKEIHGFEPLFASIYLAEWRNKPFDGISLLPEKEVVLPLKGPDNVPILVLFHKERGIQFLTPFDSPPRYRLRLYQFFLDNIRVTKGALGEKLTAYEYAEDQLSPFQWWSNARYTFRINPYGSFIGAWSTGELTPDDALPPLSFDPKVIDLDKVIPRIDFRPQGWDENYPIPPHRHLVGDLYCIYAVDRGSHFQHITPELAESISADDLQVLHERSVRNMMEAIGEEGLNFSFNDAKTAGNPVVSPDYLVALFAATDLWPKIEDVIGGDLAVAIPSPFHLAVGKWTDAVVRDQLTGFCESIQTSNPTMYWNDDLYVFKGELEGWEVMK